MIQFEVLPSMTLKESASHAALTCYQSNVPQVGKLIDVENRLFRVSHHTTLQHADSYKTSEIDRISVGDITFGLHLVSPFYNSDQRSGRFAAKMFLDPDFSAMIKYVRHYWPNLSENVIQMIREYLEFGVNAFHSNKERVDELAFKFLKESRPYISSTSLDENGPKIAQEQLRMFISTLFPTALDFTLNLTALVAMYEEAWTPAMKEVSGMFAEAFSEIYPDMAYVFDPDRRRKGEWSIDVPKRDDTSIIYQPYITDLSVSNKGAYVRPKPEILHPVDRLHFSPEMMDNSIGDISMTVGMSVATMGQDQRHRTLRRGAPRFTGEFYLPPLLREVGLEEEALKTMDMWTEIAEHVPGTLAMVLAPYGAVVTYTKRGSFNAILHEQYKRLCWCAQEEIYYLGVLEREEIARQFGDDDELLTIFQPFCFETEKCAEGGRFCGRDITETRQGNKYFPRRIV